MAFTARRVSSFGQHHERLADALRVLFQRAIRGDCSGCRALLGSLSSTGGDPVQLARCVYLQRELSQRPTFARLTSASPVLLARGVTVVSCRRVEADAWS